MTNAIETIMNQLNEIFVPMDEKVLEDTQVWAKGRVAAIKEFKSNPEKDKLARKDQWAYYDELYRIAGGKGWYNVFNGRNAAMIEEMVVKHCARVAESRNASISKKLIKAEVSEVTGTEFTRTSDGFNGTFVVETNKGRKVVYIQTIYAGGYNIQCAHMRVLVKVK